MKILSLNCHCGQELKEESCYSALISNILGEDYDVILLQEVPQSISSPLIEEHLGVGIREDNLAKNIVKSLEEAGQNYHYYWDYSHIGFDTYEEGLAILSKERVLEASSKYVSKNTSKKFWKSRLIIKVKLATFDQVFLTGHYGWEHDHEEPFDEQWLKTIAFVGDDKAVLTGDFNNSPTTRAYKQICSSNFRDSFIEKVSGDNPTFFAQAGQGTIEEVNVGKRIDYVLTNDERLRVKTVKRVFAKDLGQMMISDHVGIVVEYEES